MHLFLGCYTPMLYDQSSTQGQDEPFGAKPYKDESRRIKMKLRIKST